MSKKKKIAGIAAALCIAGAAAVWLILPGNSPKEENRRLIYQADPQMAGKQEGKDMETLSIGVSSGVSGIHPYQNDDETMQVLLRLVYEPLLLIRSDASIEYRNAKEIVFKEQGKQAAVEVNTGKCFSDGTKLDADIILASYEWFLNGDTSYGGIVSRIESIDKVDDQTLIVTFYEADPDNMKVFSLPIVYDADKVSEKGSTFLGTGPYRIDFLAPYQDVILAGNEAFQEKGRTGDENAGLEAGYSKIIIGQIDYSKLDEILEAQKYDMFYIDKEEMAQKVKESNAYDIYETGSETGYYLIYHMEERAGRGVAGLCRDQDLWKDISIQGIWSNGILSPYMQEPNYYSSIEKGSLDEIRNVNIVHGFDGASMGIYEKLSAMLSKEGVECQETMADTTVLAGAKEDILIYYGSYKDAVSDAQISAFYELNKEIKAEDFYGKLEQYLTSVNLMTPLTKDTVWTAFLSGRDTMDFFR